jgi:hypothetical protein
MAPSIDDIRNWIETHISDVYVDATTPDLFFFAGNERSFPFATVVTHDDEHDRSSDLDREGVFRLNMAVSKSDFARLFPDLGSRTALENADIDYRQMDALFPHPVYGRMSWVSSLNPDRVWGDCQSLMLNANGTRTQ